MDWKSKRVRAILEGALIEDKAAGDITTALTIDRKLRATATIVANQPCVVAGLGCIPVILELYAELSAKSGAAPPGRFTVVSHTEIFDGVKVRKGQTLAIIRSNAAALLSTERVMLNLLQRMCGIATLTNDFVKAVTGTKARVIDTRKTVPNLRVLDKYAVCAGGGTNHRLDLQDGILVTNNHIALGGGVTATLNNAMKFRRGKQPIQVEVRSQIELDQAIAAHPESILLANMTPQVVRKAVKQIRLTLPAIPIEAAGSVTLATVRKYALTGVDFIGVGALTYSASAADLAMRLAPDAS